MTRLALIFGRATNEVGLHEFVSAVGAFYKFVSRVQLQFSEGNNFTMMERTTTIPRALWCFHELSHCSFCLISGGSGLLGNPFAGAGSAPRTATIESWYRSHGQPFAFAKKNTICTEIARLLEEGTRHADERLESSSDCQSQQHALTVMLRADAHQLTAKADELEQVMVQVREQVVAPKCAWQLEAFATEEKEERPSEMEIVAMASLRETDIETRVSGFRLASRRVAEQSLKEASAEETRSHQ